MYSVYSWPELWTVAFGWQVYNIIWEAIIDTGAIFAPFFLVMAKHVDGSIKKAGTEGGIYAFRAIIQSNIKMFVVLLVALYPFKQIGLEDFKIVPVKTKNAEVKGNRGDINKGLGKANEKGRSGSIGVPYGFYFINQMLHGATIGMSRKMDEVVDYNEMAAMFQMAVIDDPGLFSETQRFIRECYSPARGKYQRYFESRLEPWQKEILEDKPVDTSWLGSELFTRTPGLYAECTGNSCPFGDGYKALSHVHHIDYDEDRGDYTTETGLKVSKPHCSDWWQSRSGAGSDVGLRGRILEYVRELHRVNPVTGDDSISLIDAIKYDFSKAAEILGMEQNLRDFEDALIRSILKKSMVKSNVVPDIAMEDKGFWAMVFGTTGSMKESVFSVVKISVIKNNLYIVLAFLMMVAIITIPLLGLFGSFSVGSMTFPLVAFTIFKISPFLWHVAYSAESKMMEQTGLNSIMKSFMSGDAMAAQNASIATLIAMSLVVILPAAIAVFLNSVVNGASSVSKAGDNMSQSTNKAASSSQQSAETSAKNATSGVKQNMAKKA